MTVSAELTRIVADARSRAPGFTTSGIQAELFAAMREFLEFSNIWREEIDIPIVANTRSYTIAPAAGGSIIRLITLFDSTDLDKKPVAPVSMNTPGVVVLGITPSQTATWVAMVSKICVDPVTVDGYPADVPDWIVRQYAGALLSGVLSKLHAQVGKPSTDNSRAMYYERKFQTGKTRARVEAIKGNVQGQQNWQFPIFAVGSQRQGG